MKRERMKDLVGRICATHTQVCDTSQRHAPVFALDTRWHDTGLVSHVLFLLLEIERDVAEIDGVLSKLKKKQNCCSSYQCCGHIEQTGGEETMKRKWKNDLVGPMVAMVGSCVIP